MKNDTSEHIKRFKEDGLDFNKLIRLHFITKINCTFF